MKHPGNSIPPVQRICPTTGRQYHLCWTNNLARPWESDGECDTCSPAGTPARELRRLNDRAALEKPCDRVDICLSVSTMKRREDN